MQTPGNGNGNATCVHIIGAEWNFERCGVTCCGGTAVVCDNGAQVSLSSCNVGGEGAGDKMAVDGIIASDESVWALDVSGRI